MLSTRNELLDQSYAKKMLKIGNAFKSLMLTHGSDFRKLAEAHITHPHAHVTQTDIQAVETELNSFINLLLLAGVNLQPINTDAILDIPAYNISLHEAFDSTHESELFLEELRKLPFYRSDLLYSGFGNTKSKKHYSRKNNPGTFFATDESGFLVDSDNINNPLYYALSDEHAEVHKKPAVVIYDPNKVSQVYLDNYAFKDSNPYVAIIHIEL